MTSERRKVSGWAEKRAAGSRRKGSVSAGESKGVDRPCGRVRAGPAAQTARQAGPEPTAGPCRQEGQEEAQHQRGGGERESAPHDLLGCPGQRDGEAGPAERLQVCRSDLPSVGEAVGELRTTEVDGVRPRPGSRPRAARPPSSPLLTLCPSTNSNGWVAPVTFAVMVSMWLEVWVTVGAAPGWVADNTGVPCEVGNPAEPVPPPAAESSVSWSRSQPVQVCGADEQVVLCPGDRLDHVGAGAQGDATGVSAAGDHLHLGAAQRLLRGSDDLHVDRVPVDGEQIPDAVARERRRCRSGASRPGCRSRRSRAARPGLPPSSSCRRTRPAPCRR